MSENELNHSVCNECDLVLDCPVTGFVNEEDGCIDDEPHLPIIKKCDCFIDVHQITERRLSS